MKEEKVKPKCALIGQDGNIFNLEPTRERKLLLNKKEK